MYFCYEPEYCLAIINTLYYIDMICDDFGFTSTAAITVFMKTVVRERRIPFEIKASSREQINKEAWEAFLEMRTQAAAAGVQDLTLDEINTEIQNARNEK